MPAPAPFRRSRSSASKPTGHRSLINLGAEHENLDQKAYHILKSMIMDRQLLPGEKIPQEKLAEDLGISRTPLINALKFLEKEKLVQSVPRRGFFMRTFTKKEMISIFELREVLEGLAARKAAQKITDKEIAQLGTFFKQFAGDKDINDIRAYAREDRRFHKFLLDIGAKEFLKSILETYNIISYSYQVIAPEGLVRHPRETIREHRAMIEAIANRDAEAAENLMRRHFQKSRAVLQESLKADD
jgi:DNA-binding GntR family transcriptional regulator